MKKPAAPANLRNGLKWRDGRPRWEPSPANRALGVKGRDLKRLDGTWMSRGEAITAADNRSAWASTLREASLQNAVGEEARRTLRIVLADLPPLETDADRHNRSLVTDLIEAAYLALDDVDAAAAVSAASGGPRTVNAMLDAYFADPGVTVSSSTREAYNTQAKLRIRPKFGARRADSLTTGELRTWYVELAGDGDKPGLISLANAAQCVAAFGAFYKWAVWHDWLATSPVHDLGIMQPQGRRVFITVAEEEAFIPWCDANGYADVADGLVTALWTAASPIDICKADIADLSGASWRFVRHKTRRSGREAMPGLTGPVKARVDRRRAATLASIERAFLIDPRTGRRHDSDSLGKRFAEARGQAVAAKAVPATFAGKQLRDARDTCITRLHESGLDINRICDWTAHSRRDAEEVLRDHYICLREEGAIASADALKGWARDNGMTWAKDNG